MATFDAGGKQWRVRLTLGMVGRLRTDAQFELGKAMDAGDFAEALIGDPVRLGKVLWVMCHKEAEERGLDAEGFFDLMGPEELEAAVVAVVQSVVEFFHPGRAAATAARLPGLLKNLNEKTGAAMAAEIESILSKPGGNSPASAASTAPT